VRPPRPEPGGGGGDDKDKEVAGEEEDDGVARSSSSSSKARGGDARKRPAPRPAKAGYDTDGTKLEWMEILEESAEYDPEIKSLLDGVDGDPNKVNPKA
jgi:hypothetical protein